MEFLKINKGMLGSNTYIYIEDDSVLLIDPGCEYEYIDKKIGAKGYRITHVLLTHAHIDHIFSLNTIREKFPEVRVYAHQLDSDVLDKPLMNGGSLFGVNYKYSHADCLIKDGDLIDFNELSFKVLHTPGHTEGGVCYFESNKKAVFTGDTLFRESIGRCDLGRGNERKLHASLRMLMNLPNETIVYPGHGIKSTIGHEKENNPFIY